MLKVDPSITLHTKSGQIEAVKRENDEHAINSKTCYKIFLPRKVGTCTYLFTGSLHNSNTKRNLLCPKINYKLFKKMLDN